MVYQTKGRGGVTAEEIFGTEGDELTGDGGNATAKIA